MIYGRRFNLINNILNLEIYSHCPHEISSGKKGIELQCACSSPSLGHHELHMSAYIADIWNKTQLIGQLLSGR